MPVEVQGEVRDELRHAVRDETRHAPQDSAPDVPGTLSPVPLMELTMSFCAFKTLAAAHELNLFSRLSAAGGGSTAAELAAELAIDERPAEMLLTACAALGLLELRDGRYVDSPLSERFLVRGRPYYFGGLVEMCDRRLYDGWGRLTDAIRTNRPTTWDPAVQESLFDGEDPAMLATFWEAMHSLSSFTARALGEALDLRGRARLLDVGGGSAAYDVELCRAYPQLRATVFDLPFVCEIAARNVARAGLSERIVVRPGDFFAEPALPSGHDVHLYSMIMHDWREEADRELLRKSHAALEPGGLVVISELLVDDDKAGPAPAALVSLNMLVETEGRNYTAAEYGAWLREAGFVDVRTIRFEAPGANGAVVARRP